MARKKKEEHINHERWLVSYADFITLLFAFFTSLYAISTVDAKKAGKLVFSTRSAFNLDFFPSDKPVLGLSSPVDRPNERALKLPRERVVTKVGERGPGRGGSESLSRSRELRAAFEDLQKMIEIKHIKNMSVTITRRGVVLSLRDVALFDSGYADIHKSALPLLDIIAEKVIKTKLDVRVEGHTDDTPIHNGHYHSNWDLSTARAVNVVRYFSEEFSFPPDGLSAAGYSSYHPVRENTSAEGRAANRRVDIVVLAPSPAATGDELGEQKLENPHSR